jgi:hypothetical protein
VFFAFLEVIDHLARRSCLRRPHARSIASSARSRLSRSRWGSGACHRAFPCSGVNQLPSLTPSFLTPLTRRIPAAKSALRSPQSAASYARRRTAPRQERPLMTAAFAKSRSGIDPRTMQKRQAEKELLRVQYAPDQRGTGRRLVGKRR